MSFNFTLPTVSRRFFSRNLSSQFMCSQHLFNNDIFLLGKPAEDAKPPRVITAATGFHFGLHTYIEVHFAGGVKVTGTRKESPYGLKMTEHGSIGAHGLF